MTVIGVLQKNNEVVMIVQPEELLTTGCLWEKLLFPIDIDGLVLGVSSLPGRIMNPDYRSHIEQ